MGKWKGRWVGRLIGRYICFLVKIYRYILYIHYIYMHK